MLAALAGAAAAQTTSSADSAAAAPVDEPRRRRERRREAAAAAETADADDGAAPPESAAVATAVEDDESEIVCKSIKVIGTKIPRRVCGTPEQWAAQQKRTTDDAQEALRQVHQRSGVATQPAGSSPSPAGGPN